MSVTCPTRGEPWDLMHVTQEEPHAWGLNEQQLKRILKTTQFDGPADPIRHEAEAAGWEFPGNSLRVFTKCPCCRLNGVLPDADTSILRKKILSDLIECDA